MVIVRDCTRFSVRSRNRARVRNRSRVKVEKGLQLGIELGLGVGLVLELPLNLMVYCTYPFVFSVEYVQGKHGHIFSSISVLLYSHLLH